MVRASTSRKFVVSHLNVIRNVVSTPYATVDCQPCIKSWLSIEMQFNCTLTILHITMVIGVFRNGCYIEPVFIIKCDILFDRNTISGIKTLYHSEVGTKPRSEERRVGKECRSRW